MVICSLIGAILSMKIVFKWPHFLVKKGSLKKNIQASLDWLLTTCFFVHYFYSVSKKFEEIRQKFIDNFSNTLALPDYNADRRPRLVFAHVDKSTHVTNTRRHVVTHRLYVCLMPPLDKACLVLEIVFVSWGGKKYHDRCVSHEINKKWSNVSTGRNSFCCGQLCKGQTDESPCNGLAKKEKVNFLFNFSFSPPPNEIIHIRSSSVGEDQRRVMSLETWLPPNSSPLLSLSRLWISNFAKRGARNKSWILSET